jgi:DedD protein
MKQRLVGTLVLGSLALILIPLLLDGEGVERPPLSVNTPPAPLIDTTPLADPIRPAITGDDIVEAFDISDALDGEFAQDLAGDDAEAPAAEEREASPAPAVAAAPVPAPANPVAATPPPAPKPATPAAPQSSQTAQSTQAAPTPSSASTPALGASGLPEGFTVRVGSFGNRANADALVARLVAAGQKAYIRPVQTAQGPLSAVFVGPVATRNEANRLQGELKSRFQLSDAIVQRYDIGQ